MKRSDLFHLPHATVVCLPQDSRRRYLSVKGLDLGTGTQNAKFKHHTYLLDSIVLFRQFLAFN